MDTANFSPFSDPQVRRKQQITARASFKAFNAVAKVMLEGLKKLYPSDPTLRLISNEFAEMIDPERKPLQIKTPALNFFREMRKPYRNSSGEECQYIELLAKHDEFAFEDPPVSILKGMRMSSKWKTMSEQEKAWCWEYLDRLIQLSAQAVYNGSSAVDEMNALSRTVVTAALAGKSTPEQMVEDPSVKEAASAFVDTIK